MAKNGATAATATAELNDTYDQLSLDERDIFDRIAAQGFKPVPAGRGWAADGKDEGGRMKDECRIGPFPTLGELEAAVREANPEFELTGEGGDLVLEETANGDLHAAAEKLKSSNGNGKTVKVPKQPLLPNTEGAVLQNLREAILGYRATTMEIITLQEQQKTEKATVKALMHKFEDELSVDPETGFKYYQVETIKATLETVVKEELKTEKVEGR